VVGDWLALPGMLFLSLIQMIVVPLIVTAIIRGIAASSDAEQLRRNGLFLAGYFVATTIVATAIGIGLAHTSQPGRFVDPVSFEQATEAPAVELDPEVAGPGVDLSRLPEQFISVFPSNPLLSMVEGEMLEIVVFSVLVGLALLSLSPEKAKPLLDLAGSLQDLTMKIVAWGGRMAVYMGIVRVLGDGRPWRFLRGSRDALLLAFSTDSSAATMPVTIRVAEEELEIRPSISQFVIPIRRA
jgi:Na+/H+-dicarboxylate symporter